MIPALLNASAGTAEAVQQFLEDDPRFALELVEPARLPYVVQTHLEQGAQRVLVAGGDGTLAAAAGVIASHAAELAVLPAGTRNHFVKRLGIPMDLPQALDIAAGPSTRLVDVGRVNDRVFLNTSSVGAYVSLVRRRDRLRPWLGYALASAVAATGLLVRLRTLSLELETNGSRDRYRTPLLFISVGERDLKLPGLSDTPEGDNSTLHAIVVRGKRRARLLALALATATGGIERVEQAPEVDSFLVDRCRVDFPRRKIYIAIDGEIVKLRPPLQYTLMRRALTVAAPATADPLKPDRSPWI